jgi:hypothetical protein
VDVIRRLLGASHYREIERRLRASAQARKQSKLFSCEQVSCLIKRIEKSVHASGSVKVLGMPAERLVRSRLASGHSICLVA